MAFDLMIFSGSLAAKQAVLDILSCNEFSEQYALTLTEQQASELALTRTTSLKDTGRIEFGGGVIDKIIKSFCDSPYIPQDNYAETLHTLIETFYYFKNESLDLMGDDDLIRLMKKSFDGKCQGSLDLLANSELETMARNIRFGFAPEYQETAPEETEDDGDDQY